MKRVFEGPYLFTRSKKAKLVNPLEIKRNYWINATDTRNYILKDTLVDWLKFTEKKDKTNNKINDFILEKGKEFEKDIVDYIDKNILKIHTVSSHITDESCKKVIELMRQGVPIIHSAPFKNKKNKTKGVIDFLIRSDMIHKLCLNISLSNLEKSTGCLFSNSYHYIVIDIKFSTLPLRSDGIHLLNYGSFPAYKSQLWIYTQSLKHLQGYIPNYAFILGRRNRFTTKGEKKINLDCFDKFGKIDFNGIDSEYKTKTYEAINWLKKLYNYGNQWKINPPTIRELYPNMCIDSGIWNHRKKEISDNIGEITQIWHCGVKNREKAFENGILSWKDEKCNSELLGIKGKRAIIIDKILSINKQDKVNIYPEKISTTIYDWRKEDNEVFVDFETFTDIFSETNTLPLQEKTNFIFMIGIYYKNGEVWNYKNFISEKNDKENQNKIIDEFVKFLINLKSPKIWHWHAEEMIWGKTENKTVFNWNDLSKLFKEEPIVIKNCFNFGLKEISKAMFNHKMITTKLESECNCGLDASIKAWEVYSKTQDIKNEPIIKDIAKYNEFDVKVLCDILNFLRKNM